MKIVLWIVLGIVALNAAVVVAAVALALLDRRRRRREVRYLEGLWRLRGRSSRRALEGVGRPRTSPRRSLGRVVLQLAVFALLFCVLTAFANPDARQLLTSALGAVARVLGVNSGTESAIQPSTGSSQGVASTRSHASPAGPTVRGSNRHRHVPSPHVGPPSSPTGLTAVAASPTQIDLTWIDVSTETGYRVERSLDGASGWAPVAATGQDVTTQNDTGLSPATTYYYRVVANNERGDSAVSVVASATTGEGPPMAPSGLAAVAASSTEIDLSWNDVGTETGYRVERSLDGASDWTPVATTGQDMTAQSDTGLSPGTTYFYRVIATNGGGDSPPSDTAQATTETEPPTPPSPPGSPSGLTAVAASSTEIDLSWNDVGTETGYRVERSLDGASWITVATTGQDVTTQNDTGLSPGTVYYYRVFATNPGGDSPPSDVTQAFTNPV